MPVEHFKNKRAYLANLAYRHIHGIPFRAESVVVAGKKHKVKHSKKTVARKSTVGRKRAPRKRG